MAFSYLQCSSSDLVVYQQDHDHDQDQLNLPIGYRFSPRNHELVLNYLANKILGQKLPANIITTIDLYRYDPHQLPISEFKYGKPNEAYFFNEREYIQSKGLAKRRTKSGYWKATGRDTQIFYGETVVGFKKILIFYWGKAPDGKRSPWIMHEFRVNPSLIPPNSSDYNTITTKVERHVVCKIHYKESKEDNKPSKPKRSKKIPQILEETKN
ncbi:hypothetical protein Dsin_000677 [Dipteronia sinensis]|uniref:NAC domain-containing protein n=1 Tax=Dipteronia sinensis TaxID=43782 RepID=A0AAE0B2X6_9ROSI|nr:hypothetical protein Dsin_000677 [Dipteronia sinensis]